MFHHHEAFDRVSRAMRAPRILASPTPSAAVPELIEALDRLLASKAIAQARGRVGTNPRD